MRSLFVEELQRVHGGHHKPDHPRPCPEITTLACGEEGPCSSC
jgi:hypothetical protein